MSRKIYDVVVVGCGAAGIAALTKMHQHGLNVIGLEGSDRIGGRLKTTSFEETVIDLGAEWCHGEEDNVVYELVKDLNLLKSVKGLYEIVYFKSDGQAVHSEDSSKITQLISKINENTKNKMNDSEESYGWHLKAEFDSLIESSDLLGMDLSLAKDSFNWLLSYENSIQASDSCFDASAVGLLEYWDCKGNLQLNWSGIGYSKILDVLTKKYPNPGDEIPINVLLSHEVEKIYWNKDEKGDELITQVSCKNGTSFYAKHVIITMSLGVLKERHEKMFVPSLPSLKVNSIKGLTLGTVNKMFLFFDKVWWPADFKWVAFLWSDEERKKLSMKDLWISDMFGFNTNESGKPAMCFWLTGTSARHMETLSPQTVQDGIMMALKMFMGNHFDIPSPKKIMRSTWYSDPLIRGSYSFRSMDSEKYGTSSSELAKPLLNKAGIPTLCFAGEASSTHYFSTVHGAIESGFREADRLIKFQQSKSKESIFCKVVIIGAGLAGLSAAKFLNDKGITDIKLLEAQSEIGGRVCSLKWGKDYVELGAQWLHGQTNNLTVFAESNQLLSQLMSYEGEGQFLRSDGYIYEDSMIERVNNVINDILKKCELLNQIEINCDFSVGDFLKKEFEFYIKDEVPSDQLSRWNELLEWHIKFQSIDNSCPTLESLSAKSWGMYDFDGDDCQGHISFKNGYKSVVKKLSDELDPQMIVCNSPVVKVDWSNGTKKRNLQVYCKDHTIYETDHLIVTISLGVLKNTHLKMFHPNLPRLHSNTINALGFGAMGKVIIQFEDKWWGNTKGFQFTWKEGIDSEQMYPPWVKHISGFDVLSVGPPNTLMGWVTSQGIEIMENLPKKTVLEDCLHVLRMFTKKTLPITSVVNFDRSTWLTNPYFGGCYSHVTRECDMNEVGPGCLGDPIFNDKGCPIILFGGEACHSNYFSTAHGAYESGKKQANLIIDYMKMQCNKED